MALSMLLTLLSILSYLIDIEYKPSHNKPTQRNLSKTNIYRDYVHNPIFCLG